MLGSTRAPAAGVASVCLALIWRGSTFPSTAFSTTGPTSAPPLYAVSGLNVLLATICARVKYNIH